MTTEQKKYTGVTVALLVLAIIIFWKPISSLWKGGDMASNTPLDGTGCTTADGHAGSYAGGICVPTGRPNPTGGSGSAETERTGVKKTHCVPRTLGTQCTPRVYVNGHWFAIDPKNTTATTCCYTMIS